jgi:hypothetical protein
MPTKHAAVRVVTTLTLIRAVLVATGKAGDPAVPAGPQFTVPAEART